MGYYTKFDLSWSIEDNTFEDDETRKELEEAIVNATSKTVKATLSNALSELNSNSYEERIARVLAKPGDYLPNIEEGKYAFPVGDNAESCKWYSHEDDMRKLSIYFPNVLFTLSGEGEESGDIWEKHFLNGKTQHCKAKIVIEALDRTKLK